MFRKIVAISSLALLAASTLLTGCGSGKSGPARTLNGAGATFPYPVYSKWAYEYSQLTAMKLNYQSIGSGAGIAQITAGTVDFGASDAPLGKAELDEAGLFQFPMVTGGVTPVVNIAGIAPGQLRLTPELLAGIYLGKITKWNDPSIAAVNPGLALPVRSITVVHRADGSGTTWIFTKYLDAVSPEWHGKIGADKAVNWPAGVGGKGNEGVAAYVQRLDGTIGYVEFAYALQNKMNHVLLRNRDGEFVAPSIESFQSAAANADWANTPGFGVVLTDQPGKGSWPITGATFILIHKDQKNPALATDMLAFFAWCYEHGGETARALDYVPMPPNVVALVETAWAAEITSGGQPVWKTVNAR